MDRSKLLIHQVGLSVSCVMEQEFINTPISVTRFPLKLLDKSIVALNILFSEKSLFLPVTALTRSSVKPSDMSAMLGTGGKSPLILPNSGLFSNLSMVRWLLQHVFHYVKLRRNYMFTVFECYLHQGQTEWHNFASTTITACY